jgi:hypothetical protein
MKQISMLVLAALLSTTLVAASAKAEPTLEAQAAYSAKDFDFNGIRDAAPAGSVDASKELRAMASGAARSGRKPMKTSGTRNLAVDVPAPNSTPTTADPVKPAGSSLGAKICTAAGSTAGILATVYLAFGNPLALAALAVGGAVVGYSAAKREGLKGRQVFGAVFSGANEGTSVFVNAGTSAGRAVGRFLEKLF